jgi:predicted RecA/RadA family phage recombinase
MAQTLHSIHHQGDQSPRYDHTPGGAIACGAVVDLGDIVGLCTSPEGIAANTLGSLATRGIFKMRKLASDAVAYTVIGKEVWWDTVNFKVVPATAANCIRLGIIAEPALSTDDNLKVDINRLPTQAVVPTTTT